MDWQRFGDVVSVENGRASLRLPRAEAPALIARLLMELSVADLAVEEPPLESVIDQVYREGIAAGEVEAAGGRPMAAGAGA